MPWVVLRAADMGIRGAETPADLEAHAALRAWLEAIRLACGPLRDLGDVGENSVPKMTQVSAPRQRGVIATRTFIAHRCHKTIGVLGAVPVVTACFLEGTGL